MLKKIGVLASGGGTNLQSIIDNIDSGYINAELSVVISNKKNAYALARAQKHGIPAYFVDRREYSSNQEYDEQIMKILCKHGVDIVVLAGYLLILTKKFVKRYKNRIINIHPSLIPSFCGGGYYGIKVHQAVLDYGVKVTGATVHFVDEGTDTGPIIMQQAAQVLPDDTPETLQERVLEIEHRILPEAVKLLAEDKIDVKGRKVFIK
ncbi:MAG: phosphoribosylglycinamide formyltransferase [Clostridia bacterium]|nr:phosphoribosylglycinamide formyltransferase [Clostridia bacterium]